MRRSQNTSPTGASRTGASCCRTTATIRCSRSAPNVEWNDLVRGEEKIDLASLSDPILIREDGTYLYTLPSVTDDIDMSITHGHPGGRSCHPNTAVQIALFKALGAEPPTFGHHTC